MANVINYENFNVKNIKLSVENKKYLYINDKYHFKKIMPKYMYEDGIEENMYIQLPEGLSYGIKTFDNTTKNDNKAPPSHSFSLAIDALVSNDIDEKMKVIQMFEQIQERIKAFLYEENVMKKLGRLSDKTKLRNMEWSEEKIMKKLDKEKDVWATAIDGIKSFLSYQIDKETNEKNEASGPTLFMKLKTDKSKNPLIKTVFRQINSNNEIEEIPQTSLPELFQGVRCIAIGVVHIESIYIPKLNNISIQFNIHEVLITKLIPQDESRIQLPGNYLGLTLKTNNKVDKIFDSDDDDDDEIVHSNSSSNKNSNEVKPIKKIIRRFPTKENDDESSNDEKHVDVDAVKPKPIIKKVINKRSPTKENN